MRHRLLDTRLGWLRDGDNAALLRGGLRGLEKESLRVDRRGYLAYTPHPPGLGSALTHPYLTTDYSEALLELVTPAYPSTWETLQFLCDLHTFVTDHLEDELLWVQSMPCRIDSGVPIAVYGSSNLGRMKSVYRRGLGFRYGRSMQTISGVHFNYSLPLDFWAPYREREKSARSLKDFTSHHYMGAIRNYRRLAWLLIYLYGASPALCKSFRTQRQAVLEELDADTWYAPFGTSLRMSDIGYRNRSQAELQISVNSLDSYLAAMVAAVTTPHPRYESVGVFVDGEYRQLNSNTLQIEAEYYSSIRPKPPAGNAHRPTVALRDEGVAYLEVRTLDCNTMDPVGVNQTQLRFVEALLIHCLLTESPAIDAAEQAEIDARDLLVAREGRRPGLELPRGGRTVELTRWAREELERVRDVAALLDEDREDYVDAVDAQLAAIDDSGLTPAAQILRHLSDEGASYFELARETSRSHRDYFDALRLTAAKRAWLESLSSESLVQQERLEAESRQPFADYLKDYFARV